MFLGSLYLGIEKSYSYFTIVSVDLYAWIIFQERERWKGTVFLNKNLLPPVKYIQEYFSLHRGTDIFRNFLLDIRFTQKHYCLCFLILFNSARFSEDWILLGTPAPLKTRHWLTVSFSFFLAGRANCITRRTFAGRSSRRNWSFGAWMRTKWNLVVGWLTLR